MSIVKIAVAVIADYSRNVIYTIDIFRCLFAVCVNFKYNMVSGVIEIFLYVSIDILTDTYAVSVVAELYSIFTCIGDNYLILYIFLI